MTCASSSGQKCAAVRNTVGEIRVPEQYSQVPSPYWVGETSPPTFGCWLPSSVPLMIAVAGAREHLRTGRRRAWVGRAGDDACMTPEGRWTPTFDSGRRRVKRRLKSARLSGRRGARPVGHAGRGRSGREPQMLLVPRQLQRAGMTGDVPYYGGRFSPAQAYAASHPHARPVAPSRPLQRARPEPPHPKSRPTGRPATSPRNRRDHTGGTPAAAQSCGAMSGPVQVLVVGFEVAAMSGEILAELTRLGEAGVVRLLDVLLVSRTEDGGLETLPLHRVPGRTSASSPPRSSTRRTSEAHLWRLGPDRIGPSRRPCPRAASPRSP